MKRITLEITVYRVNMQVFIDKYDLSDFQAVQLRLF